MSDPRIIYLASIAYRPGVKIDPPVKDANIERALRSRIEQFLIGSLIPALLPAGGTWSRRFPWYPSWAQPWLEFLALKDLRDPVEWGRPTGLDDPGTSRIAWWNLHRAFRFLRKHQAPLRGLVAGIVAFGHARSSSVPPTAPRIQLGLQPHDGRRLRPADIDRRRFLERRGQPGARHRARDWQFTARHLVVDGPLLLGAVVADHPGGGCRLLLLRHTDRDTGCQETRRDAGWPTDRALGWFRQGAVLLVLAYIIAGVPAAPRTVRASDFPSPGRPGIRTFTTAVLLGLAFGLLWGAAAVLKHESSQTPNLGPAIGTGLITGVDFVLGAWLFRWSRRWFRLGQRLRSPVRRPDGPGGGDSPPVHPRAYLCVLLRDHRALPLRRQLRAHLVRGRLCVR